MRGVHATMNYLWRGARRLARENPGDEVRTEYITPVFDLYGRRVQCEVVVIIRPLDESNEEAEKCA